MPPEMNHTVIFDGPSTENDIYLFVGVLPDIAEAPPVLSLYVPLYPSENVLLLLSTVIGVPSLHKGGNAEPYVAGGHGDPPLRYGYYL